MPKIKIHLKDGSRSLGLFRKDKIRIIAKFHMTDLVILGHSRDWKTLSYSRIKTVVDSFFKKPSTSREA